MADDPVHILPDAGGACSRWVLTWLAWTFSSFAGCHINQCQKISRKIFWRSLVSACSSFRNSPTGDHADLRELIPCQADDLLDGPVNILDFGNDSTVRVGELGVGRLLCGAVRALSPRVFRVAADGVLLVVIGEVQLHKGRVGVLGVLGAGMSAFRLSPLAETVQGKGDGVKNRGFPRAGVARDQIQAALTQLGKIQLLDL